MVNILNFTDNSVSAATRLRCCGEVPWLPQNRIYENKVCVAEAIVCIRLLQRCDFLSKKYLFLQFSYKMIYFPGFRTKSTFKIYCMLNIFPYTLLLFPYPLSSQQFPLSPQFSSINFRKILQNTLSSASVANSLVLLLIYLFLCVARRKPGST